MIPQFTSRELLLWLLLLLPFTGFAQLSHGGIPLGLQPAKATQLSAISTKSLAGLDMTKVIREDKAMIETVRFAAPLAVNINPMSDGQWTTLENGDKVWQLQINVAGALGLFVVFDNFKLPAGARLFGYHPASKEKLGGYSDRNNKSHGEFMLGMIEGQSLILEYFQPANIANTVKPFQINKLFVAYNTDHIQPSNYEFKTYDGFGDAMSCNININCPQGSAWQDHKRGIVRMLRVFEEGVGWCTGSLINNTNQDGKPYLLSAFHCIAGFTPNLNLWRFDFNYEFVGCGNDPIEPVRYSLQGCQYRSGREQSDFLLLELDDVIPQFYNVYFHGWNRDDNHTPAEMTGIHHPRGDVKKISSSDDPITIFNNSIIWSNQVTTPPNHHFRVFLTEGTIEDGSSGSPLFNEAGLIAGQLHGGNASCTNGNTTYYGRFSVSWDGGSTPATRLSDWLDPNGTGQTTLGNFEYQSAQLSGKVSLPNGTGIELVRVAVTGASIVDTVLTDANGNYVIPNLRNNEVVTIQLERDGGATNGVTVSDIIDVRDDLLLFESLGPDARIAADVNENGNVSIADLIDIRDVILLNDLNFELGNWKFFENNIPIMLNGNTTKDVTVVKRGDVNFTATPDQ